MSPSGFSPGMGQPESSSTGHRPVLVDEVVRLLVTDPEGVYIDLTAGGGGHLRALASALGRNARLFGLDRDPQAVIRAQGTLSGVSQQTEIITSSFDAIDLVAKKYGLAKSAGVLLDLGLSSDQIDNPSRGFSFRVDGPLDMRFDQTGGITATELVNTKTEHDLADIIRRFGEEKDARRIARRIVTERRTAMIDTTFRLAEIISSVVSPPFRTKALARVFQALRIAANQELDRVEAVLPKAVALLAPGGRLAVISYHSLEDRIVKQFCRAGSSGYCTCPREFPVCRCGGRASLEIVTRKPVVPGDAEIESNPRARSAKLRVAAKVAV